MSVNGTAARRDDLCASPAAASPAEVPDAGRGRRPNFGAVADFNRDGWPDFAVSGLRAAGAPRACSLRNPAGGFVHGPEHAGGRRDPLGAIAAADFNGDGRVDLAVARYDRRRARRSCCSRSTAAFIAEGRADRDRRTAALHRHGRLQRRRRARTSPSPTPAADGHDPAGASRRRARAGGRSPFTVGVMPSADRGRRHQRRRPARSRRRRTAAPTRSRCSSAPAGGGFTPCRARRCACPAQPVRRRGRRLQPRRAARPRRQPDRDSTRVRAAAPARRRVRARGRLAVARGDASVRPGRVADFNRDGKPDLAIANNASSSVTVLLNTTPDPVPPPPPAAPGPGPGPTPAPDAPSINARLVLTWTVTQGLREAQRPRPCATCPAGGATVKISCKTCKVSQTVTAKKRDAHADQAAQQEAQARRVVHGHRVRSPGYSGAHVHAQGQELRAHEGGAAQGREGAVQRDAHGSRAPSAG